MRTTKKWLTALAVMSLAIAGGVVATTANATVEPEIFVAEDGSCYIIEHTDAIPAEHYALKGNSGIGQAETPATPEEDPDIWQDNTHLEPHYQGGATPADSVDGSTYVDGESGLHYTSHGSEGKRDWFYFKAEVPASDDAITVDCPIVGVPTQFSADPVPATCFAPGFFDESTLAGELIYDNENGIRGYQFDNLEVWVYADQPGQVTIVLYAEGAYVLEGLSGAWDVDSDGRTAVRTFDLEAQRSGPVACPTDGEPSPSPSPSEPVSVPTPEPTPPVTTPVPADPDFTG